MPSDFLGCGITRGNKGLSLGGSHAQQVTITWGKKITPGSLTAGCYPAEGRVPALTAEGGRTSQMEEGQDGAFWPEGPAFPAALNRTHQRAITNDAGDKMWVSRGSSNNCLYPHMLSLAWPCGKQVQCLGNQPSASQLPWKSGVWGHLSGSKLHVFLRRSGGLVEWGRRHLPIVNSDGHRAAFLCLTRREDVPWQDFFCWVRCASKMPPPPHTPPSTPAPPQPSSFYASKKYFKYGCESHYPDLLFSQHNMVIKSKKSAVRKRPRLKSWPLLTCALLWQCSLSIPRSLHSK